jgi:hypothetical protein
MRRGPRGCRFIHRPRVLVSRETVLTHVDMATMLLGTTFGVTSAARVNAVRSRASAGARVALDVRPFYTSASTSRVVRPNRRHTSVRVSTRASLGVQGVVDEKPEPGIPSMDAQSRAEALKQVRLVPNAKVASRAKNIASVARVFTFRSCAPSTDRPSSIPFPRSSGFTQLSSSGSPRSRWLSLVSSLSPCATPHPRDEDLKSRTRFQPPRLEPSFLTMKKSLFSRHPSPQTNLTTHPLHRRLVSRREGEGYCCSCRPDSFPAVHA